jgi:hypothetical protein
MSTKRQPNSYVTETISKLAAKRGVYIFLDADDISQTSKEGKKFSYDEGEKLLTIVPYNLTPEEQLGVLPIVKSFLEKHHLLLDSEQETIVQNYQGYNDNNPYTELLDLYAGKIPYNDLNALKMAFFMKAHSEEGNSIEEYKQQIRDRFGVRGAYIANLCKASYYEDSFRTKCINLSSSKFTDYYELKVGQELAALFVHSGLTIGTIREVFSEKISGCLLNDFGRFRILGFGRKNVELINEFKGQHEEHDWGTDINWVLKYSSSPPNVWGLEYDIVIP